MKNIFPQFSNSSELNYSLMWKQAVFVFDTNVLLNLYRYQSATRDELLNVLSQLSERIWIPHHVALEFQRNRLKVIAEQNRRFAEVRRTVEKAQSALVLDLDKLQLNRRHSLINPQPLIRGFEKLVADFLTDLDRLQATQQKLSGPDPLKHKIEALFDDRVGPPPEGQTAIDDLYLQAQTRFKLKIPPGYLDSDKDKDAPDEHVSGGIIYKRKYGDFLVWRQLLDQAKSNELKVVVFVTDDAKEDWWWKIDSDGPKTIGPRPELIEEAKLEAGIESLLMYNPEGFLKYATEFLKAPVSEETLNEVRDVSTIRALRTPSYTEFRKNSQRVRRAVQLWLEGLFNEKVTENRGSFPDYVIEREIGSLGFEVKVMLQPNIGGYLFQNFLRRAYVELKMGVFTAITIVCVVESRKDAEELKQLIASSRPEMISDSLQVVIGSINESQAGVGEFYVYEEFAYNQVCGSLHRDSVGSP